MGEAGFHINFLAVIVSTLLAFVLGGLWYGPLFGNAWMKENNFSEEGLKKANMAKIFGATFILNIVIAVNLAAFLGPKQDLSFGLFAGAAAGIGWVSASLGITYLFSRKSLKLFLIDAGYQSIIYTLMGGLLGLWK